MLHNMRLEWKEHGLEHGFLCGRNSGNGRNFRKSASKLPSCEGTKGLGIAIDDRNDGVFHGCQTRVIHPEVKRLITNGPNMCQSCILVC